MIDDRETCCFLHVVKNILNADGYYLLPVNEHNDIQPDKVFMGYYDEKYICLVSKRIIYCCNVAPEFNGLKPFNTKRILDNLFALDLIKAHWVLSKEVRYCPQKRVGKTKCSVFREENNAYITLNRSGFEIFFKEEK